LDDLFAKEKLKNKTLLGIFINIQISKSYIIKPKNQRKFVLSQNVKFMEEIDKESKENGKDRYNTVRINKK
jgi:hypothetical protein